MSLPKEEMAATKEADRVGAVRAAATAEAATGAAMAAEATVAGTLRGATRLSERLNCPRRAFHRARLLATLK